MIRLYPEQLRAQLNVGLRASYLLLGNDPLLLQESQDAVRQVAAAQGFEEHHTFSIDPNTDWNAIFSLCQAMSLFASRQTLLLLLPENGPNAAINEQLLTLTGDRKSTRLNSSHVSISYAVFCLKKKNMARS